MKCRTCREPAIIDLPRHNANFCAEHLQQLCRRQVEKAIQDHRMFEPTDHLLVAVSGGKDSLAVWDILNELGYRTTGLYIGLGIGDYSDESRDFAQRFATERGLDLVVESLRGDHGFDVPTAAKATGRVPCSACGMSKRHIFDRVARDGGFDVVVTGHNLDDEAAVLFGNALRWDVEYLARQLPVLPARQGFPRKAKPLVRLTERETAAWCIVRGIDYIVDECPMAVGNKHLAYKRALNQIEEESPGAKASYYLGFLERMAPLLSGVAELHAEDLTTCSRCGSPSGADADDHGVVVCAFCRLAERARDHAPVPVEMLGKRGSARKSGVST